MRTGKSNLIEVRCVPSGSRMWGVGCDRCPVTPFVDFVADTIHKYANFDQDFHWRCEQTSLNNSNVKILSLRVPCACARVCVGKLSVLSLASQPHLNSSKSFECVQTMAKGNQNSISSKGARIHTHTHTAPKSCYRAMCVCLVFDKVSGSGRSYRHRHRHLSTEHKGNGFARYSHHAHSTYTYSQASRRTHNQIGLINIKLLFIFSVLWLCPFLR